MADVDNIYKSYFDYIPTWKVEESIKFYSPNDEVTGRIPTVKVNTWQDFINLLKMPFFNEKGMDLIFRGQRRYDWSLQPNIARGTENGLFSKGLSDYQLMNFKRSIRGRIKDYSLILNQDDESDNEIWAIGQHYGLNTPLLDWTYSPYVALFFAFSKKDQKQEKDNEYRAIYIANKSLLEELEAIEFVEPKVDMYGRLVNQAGLFIKATADSTIESNIIDAISGDKDGSILGDDDFSDEVAKYICKIYIKNTPEIQKDCMNALRLMNVHYANLFPDLVGAADYCNMLSELFVEQQIRIENRIDLAKLIPHHEIRMDVNALIDEDKESTKKVINVLSQYMNQQDSSILALDIDKAVSQNKVVDFIHNDAVLAKIRISWKRLLKQNDFNERAIEDCINQFTKIYFTE